MFRSIWLILVLPLAATLAGCPSNSPSSPSGNSTSNPTPTFTAATATATNSPTVTVSRTPTSSPTATATSTPPITPTATPTGTVTQTPTNSPTGTVTGTPTDTATSTPTPPCQIGIASAIVGDYNTGGLDVLLFRYQAPVGSSFIYSMTSKIACPAGSDYFQYGVYADDGAGNPTNLIGSSPVTTFSLLSPTAFTPETISFGSPIPITGGSYYWLAFLGNVFLYDDNSTTAEYSVLSVSAGPTPMPAGPISSSVSSPITGQPFFYLYGTTCP